MARILVVPYCSMRLTEHGLQNHRVLIRVGKKDFIVIL